MAVGDLGLNVATTRGLLEKLQRAVITLQESALRAAALAEARKLPGCSLKDYRNRRVQTLFGEVTFSMPRLRTPKGVRSYLSWPKHIRSHPEFDFVRAQFCAWMSFGKARSMLGQLFPVAAGICTATLHRRLAKSAETLDRWLEGSTAEPAETMVLPLDTTFIRGNWRGAQRNMEIMVGAAERDRERVTYFSAPVSMTDACVHVGQRHMTSMGWGATTSLTAFTDGGRNVQVLAARMGASERPITDWFHISMRIQHVAASVEGFPTPTRAMATSKASIVRKVERMRHRLWQGHPTAVTDAERGLKADLRTYAGDPQRKVWQEQAKKLKACLGKLRDYTESPQIRQVNYGARHRAGERVGTSLVESGAEFIVNARMARSQHMRWSDQGAYNLLQVRTADINGTLQPALLAA